ncbi:MULTISPECIES: LCP family protein [unclassified Paenibacillus]|uniref:LCP family protein n=1 Tax=unclassified Paenibacillus TaxID=185978 RepID=UPI002F3F277F
MNRKRWIYAGSALAVALIAVLYLNRGALAMLGFDWFVEGHVKEQLEKTYQPLEGRENNYPTNVVNKKADPIAFLLMGIDQRGKETGRSDTLLYAVVRPSDGNILLVSIPRDMYVEIVGRDRKDKINHAFAFGGAGMSMDTVEKLLDSPVHYYASINFEGFKQVIDELGGIALPIEKDIENKDPNHDYFFIKGGQSLYNGTDALNFVRYREDAGGDMSRTERNQQLLSAMMDKATNMNQWMKIPQLINILGNNFQTDMRPDNLVDLAQVMLQSKQRNIYNHTLAGEGHRLESGGAWYYFADEKDLSKVQAMIKNWLDPSVKDANLILPEKYLKDKESQVQSITSAADRSE